MREAYGRLFVEQERAQTLSANEDRRREIELLTRQVALINNPLKNLLFGSNLPNEVPAILKRGERVLNRKEARAYERGDPRSSGAVVNVTIQTPNPTAFDASRTQIAAGLARAVRSGMRGL
jgi:hypothetical protein